MTRLKEHRERQGFSLRKLADMSGVHFVTLARIQAGGLDPRLSTPVKLTKALGVTLSELVEQPKRKGGK